MEKCPCASVVVCAISCMRWSSPISVTVSPAAGVCVVPLVTLPVMVAAEAVAAKANMAQSARTVSLILIFLFRGATLGERDMQLQLLNLRQHRGRLVLQGSALRRIIFSRILARTVFEIQVAEILVQHVFLFAQ